MTSEQRLHQWLRKQLEPCDYQRVEGAATGFPDVNVAKGGMNQWIELKVYTRGRTLLRKEQFAWAQRRAAHGDYVYVVSWHEKLDMIHVWKITEWTQVIPYSKYLQITSVPDLDFHRENCPIKTILFGP